MTALAIRQKSLWNALAQFGSEPRYISLLRRLNGDQQATVLTDKESDVFEIQRETKQRDPDDLTRWRERHGFSSGRFTGRLPLKLTVRRPRAIILNIPGTTQKHDVTSRKARRVWIENPPWKYKNSQQPLIEQKKGGVNRQHQSSGSISETVCEVSRANNVRWTSNNGNQESNPSSLSIIYQGQAGANIEILPLTTQTIDAMQDASLHFAKRAKVRENMKDQTTRKEKRRRVVRSQ